MVRCCMTSRPTLCDNALRIGGALATCLLATALLAACAPADEHMQAGAAAPAVSPAATAADEVLPASAQAPAIETGTVGGDGSPIQLDPLTAAEIEQAGLQGELACSFGNAGASPLLHATGVVGSDSPAQGVVKIEGYVERVGAPGGFNGMTRDPVFSGQGKTIRIERTGEASGGGESPAHPATLTYLRADGASRTFEGQWRCGP